MRALFIGLIFLRYGLDALALQLRRLLGVLHLLGVQKRTNNATQVRRHILLSVKRAEVRRTGTRHRHGFGGSKRRLPLS